jgi:hypothetical protein
LIGQSADLTINLLSSKYRTDQHAVRKQLAEQGRMASHTAGSVVTEARASMVIVSDGAAATVEVTADNKNIGFVDAGQATEIKLETFT